MNRSEDRDDSVCINYFLTLPWFELMTSISTREGKGFRENSSSSKEERGLARLKYSRQILQTGARSGCLFRSQPHRRSMWLHFFRSVGLLGVWRNGQSETLLPTTCTSIKLFLFMCFGLWTFSQLRSVIHFKLKESFISS